MARKAPSDTKIGLLRAAEACFVERGLEGTKVEDITVRAGIAKGAFYTYFESKEECWRQIVDAFLVRLSEACEEPAALLDRQRPFPERHRLSLEFDISVLNFCWENRAMLGVLLNGAGGAAYAHLLDEFAARSAKNSEQRVRELCAEGVFERGTDPKLVAALVAGAYERLVRRLIKDHKRPAIERLARQTKQVFERGLLSAETRALLDRPVMKSERRARNGTPAVTPRRRFAAALADSARRPK